jgi:hypothetical protein
MEWPSWWEWELALSSHLQKRMEDRGFNEVDLRDMLERARGYREDVVEGRWVISTSHQRNRWEVVVEPDHEDERLVVVTAYAVD